MSEKEHTTPPQQTNIEEARASLKLRTYDIIRRLLVGFIIVSIAGGAFSYIFYTPKAYSIEMQSRELAQKFQLLQERIQTAELQLSEIAERNNNVYRPLFGLDTIGSYISIKERLDEYNPLIQSTSDKYGTIIAKTNEAINIFAYNLYNQSTSLDQIQTMAKDNATLMNSIPAVWPIDRTLLKWGGRPYGMLMHPIYKRYIMHNGVDLPGTTGDPIYATADGVVTRSEQGYRTTGYGQMIKIDHGFGYQTLFGHMSKRYVFKGDSVRRGDVIGLMGSTGGSTGPHLHYEVIINNKTADPVSFFKRTMSKEEYQQIQEKMTATMDAHEPFDLQ